MSDSSITMDEFEETDSSSSERIVCQLIIFVFILFGIIQKLLK